MTSSPPRPPRGTNVSRVQAGIADRLSTLYGPLVDEPLPAEIVERLNKLDDPPSVKAAFQQTYGSLTEPVPDTIADLLGRLDQDKPDPSGS